MKLFFSATALLFVFSFIFVGASTRYQSPRYAKLADKITEKVARELKAKKNLYLIGTGESMMNDIKMMAMSFDYYQEVDLKTARELIVYTTKEYLSAINNDTDVRPFLHNYPFTAKNVKIRIFVYNPDRSRLPLEKIYCIECINGNVEYYNRLDTFNGFYKESYEQALQEVSQK